MVKQSLFAGFSILLTLGCGGSPVAPGETVEEGEWLPGGDTTNTILFGPNAFLRPAANLEFDNELAFYGGNGFFNQGWVEAPASTKARDGLGPLFNARTCSGCHFRDGKAAPPDEGEGPFVGLLFRISVPGADGPEDDPVYGGQIQDQAIDDVPVEAIPVVAYEEVAGTYDDGTPYSLLHPSYSLTNPGYGAFDEEMMLSPRIAPHMVGLGLLEAIPVSRLQALADPDDANGDGISGKLQWHQTDDGPLPGRFGWKADSPTVLDQSAGAFVGDMGLTSRLHTKDTCTATQADCLTQTNGGEPEVSDHILSRVVLYSRVIAVPARRAVDDATVLKGKGLFKAIGCDGCHTASHTTGEGAIPEVSDQLIWPYTDLLLHDMGEGLADNRPLGEASEQEWKTPPLWSLGLMKEVTGHTRYLHDGRARNLEEAILWHGGEAEPSRDAFRALNADERASLLLFLADL